MLSIVHDFKIFKANFPTLLDMSGYKMDFLAKRIGMASSSFSIKKKRNSFDLDEMQALLDIIWNDYLEGAFLAEAMKQGQNEGHLSKKETEDLFRSWRS